VRAHHERPDGRGYPHALEAGEVPLASCVIAVCDAYDAMTSDRPYQRPLAAEAALAELEAGIGTQFDARAVTALIETEGP
jgi:HD-GYP domain-containing protein (c-di-GMP phosphodiesterase class II)